MAPRIREVETENEARRRLARLDTQPAAMGFDDAFANGQPEAEAEAAKEDLEQLAAHAGEHQLDGCDGSRVAADSRTINDGNWHHLAAVLTLGTGVTFYVDGVLKVIVPAIVPGGTSLFTVLSSFGASARVERNDTTFGLIVSLV